MSKYTVTLDAVEVFHNGMTKFIKCPCDCTGVTDIVLRQASGEVIGTFTICDANGDTTHDVGNVWRSGQYIMVRFDLDGMRAQVLNGANSKALSAHKNDKSNPHDVSASQVDVGTDVEKALGLASGSTVVAAFLALHSGKCSIASGAYVGHLGVSDPATSVSIEFPFRPKLIVCVPNNMTTGEKGWLYAGGSRVVDINPAGTGTSKGYHSISFSGNTASIGAASDNADAFDNICRKDTTYYWVAFG